MTTSNNKTKLEYVELDEYENVIFSSHNNDENNIPVGTKIIFFMMISFLFIISIVAGLVAVWVT